MKKILLLIFFVILSKATYCQSTNQTQTNDGDDLIIMTKSNHEALRKDQEDHKLLLIKYQSLRVEQEVLVGDIDRLSKFLDSKNELLVSARKRAESLDNEVTSLKILIEELSKKNSGLENDYSRVASNYYKEKNKVHNMQKQQANVYIWQGLAVFFFVMMLVVGTLN